MEMEIEIEREMEMGVDGTERRVTRGIEKVAKLGLRG